MATATLKKIDRETLSVLSSVEWNGDAAVLTCGQLDRGLYVKVNKVLEALGGKWNRKAKAHLFDGDAQDALEAVIESGGYADAKREFQFFETPDALADEIVRLAEIDDDSVILEPSAGSGQLIRAIDSVSPNKQSLPEVVAVEIQERFRETLQHFASETHAADFLGVAPGSIGGPFNRVVMNPPFAPRQADIDHVLHAWKFLQSGGRLVSIMSSGWTFRTNKKSEQFKAFVDQHGGRVIKNSPDAFKASGTRVNTVTVVIDKP